ncbi:hypothetical protein J6590_005963 [Homalodisca vitripennis]|nr:hypothetical protein J6590_005963 [Homalodisca vitripennis]
MKSSQNVLSVLQYFIPVARASVLVKLDDLEKSHKDIFVRCDGLERDRDGMREELRNLQQKMNDSEQHTQCANLEILGIPLTPGEDIYMCLEHISKSSSCLVWCGSLGWQRRGTRKESTPRRSHPPLLTPGNVYINEQLIPHNKALPGQARRLVRAKKIQFAGFFNGKIIIKPTENTNSIRVLHMEDLDQCDS